MIKKLGPTLVAALALIASCGGDSPQDTFEARLDLAKDKAEAIIDGEATLYDLATLYNPECRQEFTEAVAAAQALGVDVDAMAAAEFQAQIDSGSWGIESVEMVSDTEAVSGIGDNLTEWVHNGTDWFIEECGDS